MSESAHGAVLKTLAVLLGLWGVIEFFEGLAAGSLLGKLGIPAFGLFMLVTAVGFWKRQRWAFLVASVVLLVGFMVAWIGLLVSFDTGEGTGGWLASLLADLALIAYLSRWSVESRFKPVPAEH